jgi:hypothetical protein
MPARSDGPVRVFHHPCADRGEEAGEPQVGDHDHHAEQQHDGLVVDRRVRLFHCKRGGGEHERRPDDRGAGAVDAEAGEASDGQDQIGGGEDEDGSEHELSFSQRLQ